MMRLFVFYGLLFGLFGLYLSQYLTLCRDAYKLWVQEIVYNKPIADNEKIELFSKIESLAKELCQLADAICFLFTILCIVFLITASATILELKSINTSISNETANTINTTIFNPSNIILNDSEYMILVASLIISTVLFFSLPKILGYVRIDIIHPASTGRIDEKLFDIWYKHRCFEHKHCLFKDKLQPSRLYQIFVCREGKKTFDGKIIKVPPEIKSALEKEGIVDKKKVCKKDKKEKLEKVVVDMDRVSNP